MAFTSITDYDSLAEAIRNWLNRNNFPELDAEIPTIVEFAQARINLDPDLRTRKYRQSEDVTFNGPTVSITTTGREVGEIQSIYLGQSRRNLQLTPQSLAFVTEMQGALGVPKYYTVLSQTGDTLQLAVAPSPQGTYEGVIHYYENDTPLSPAVQDNITIASYPSLLLYACLVEACIFLKDDARVRVYQGRYALIKQNIMAEEEKFARQDGMGQVVNMEMNSRFGGGVLP